MTPHAPARVAVCVATCRRPVMLRSLLASLGSLRFDDPPPHVEVVVADNDPDGGARDVVEACRSALLFPLHYVHEPRRNIALARNRGVAEALRRGATLVAFIDDDEVADPGWLAGLLEARRRFGADATVGRVSPVLPSDAPAWAREGGFFQPPRHPTGTLLDTGQTHNALVTADLLRGPAPFDPAFGISGGEDSAFFSTRRRAGARLVFVDEAVVEERIPATRLRAGWVLRRAFRVGNVAVHVERMQPAARRRLAARVAKGLLRMGYGAAGALPLGVTRGPAGLLQGLWNIAYGAGCLSALTGYRYLEYRTPHGD